MLLSTNLKVKGDAGERAVSFMRSGIDLNDQRNPRKEILSRIERKIKVFIRKKTFLTRSDIGVSLRICTLKKLYYFRFCSMNAKAGHLNTERRIEMHLYPRTLSIRTNAVESWMNAQTKRIIIHNQDEKNPIHWSYNDRWKIRASDIHNWGKTIVRRWFACKLADITRAVVTKTISNQVDRQPSLETA